MQGNHASKFKIKERKAFEKFRLTLNQQLILSSSLIQDFKIKILKFFVRMASNQVFPKLIVFDLGMTFLFYCRANNFLISLSYLHKIYMIFKRFQVELPNNTMINVYLLKR